MRRIFSTDTRGVSEVVGAVLLLGILILLLTSYQAVVVPNQNAATEFEHNQQVEDEFVDVRNAIIEARSAGRSTFASVKLGAQYQNRILAINPPPPSGTVQTTRQANLSVTEDGSGDPLRLDERPLENNFVEYTPRYFEYGSAGTIRFENTVAYHDYGETNVLLTDQTLLRGNTVSLIPVEGTFRESGTRRIAIEPMPGVLETVPVDDPVITVPTELSESDWERLLEDELDGDDEVSVSDGTLTLELDGTYDVAYAPVGVNRVPREGQRGESGSEINPAAPGDVQLVGADWSGSTVELTFRNSAEDSSFTNGRINFYSGSGNTPTQVDFINVGTNDPRGTDWVIGDDFNNFNQNIVLEGDGSTTSVDFVFDRSVNEQQDFFIVTLTLESGQQATYFVGGSFSFDGGTGNGGSGGEDINMRVDDLTQLQTDNPEFYVSYDIGISHDTVEIIAESTESTSSDSASGSDRGGETLSPGFGSNEEFDITVQALSGGDVIAERTITTNADTINPGANDDMSLAGSPGLIDAETSITDRTRVEQDNPRFRYNWEVDTGNFAEVRLLALSTTTDGASETLTQTQQTGNNVDISLSNGAEEQYKLGFLLVDSDGVVVDDVIVTDIADNTGP